jgi:hypothetical protein
LVAHGTTAWWLSLVDSLPPLSGTEKFQDLHHNSQAFQQASSWDLLGWYKYNPQVMVHLQNFEFIIQTDMKTSHTTHKLKVWR